MFCSTGGRGISVIRAFLGMAASLQALFSTCLSVCVCVCVCMCVCQNHKVVMETRLVVWIILQVPLSILTVVCVFVCSAESGKSC